MSFACRSCGAPAEVFLDLGRTPLANALRLPDDRSPEETFPLAVAFCDRCTLVQITETVPPEKLFGEYLYFSSFSTTMLDHARSLAERMTRERALGPKSFVVEAASNDGYLLRWYAEKGVPVLGVEPAKNVAAVAREKGVPTECAFFGEATAKRVRETHGAADVLHSHNVLAHVADLHGFFAGAAALLAKGGVWVNESPYVKDLLDHVEFDTIYHEHLCYYSATALAALLAKHGLELIDVERIPIHGGTLRFFASRKGENAASPRVAMLLEEERAWGVARAETYHAFARRIGDLKKELLALLDSLKRSGKRLAAYGASAKGSTLLNTFGIGSDMLEFVVDRSTYKQGRVVPGVRLPILPTEALLEKSPSHVLLLTWNFADEILSQQAEFRARGGKFILPLPAPTVL